MKKLLIIHAGPAPKSLSSVYGDFDAIIMNAIGITNADTKVVQVYKNIMPEDISNIAAIIISGSISMVTDAEDWSLNTEKWILKIIDKGIPIMGICYGHQLLAHALGGEVAYHLGGVEYGEVEIELTVAGIKDPLTSVLPKKFTNYAAHAQTVSKLPDKAKILAGNSFEPHHAVSYGDKVWGLQFHPEFNAGIMKILMEINSELLSKQGIDIGAMCENIHENDYGTKLMHRFAEISGLYN